MSAPAVADRGWVFGPLPDLLLGCGLGYALLAGGATLLSGDPATLLAWGVFLSTLTGMPHYGATLLRVYERREDRRRYAFFAVWATCAVWVAFVAGVYDRTIGSLLVTLYLTWSPWHYTGQNYGLGVLFLRRRGVELAPASKRWLHASFFLSYLMVFLAMHGGRADVAYGSTLTAGALEHVYGFRSLGIAPALVDLLFPATGLAYLAATLVAGARLRRVAAAGRALAPTVALVGAQAAWFVIPASAAFATGVDPRDRVLFYFTWVAIGHAVQYLWITTWYAVGNRPASERIAYLGRTFLAGAGIWTLPAIAFSPAGLGTVSYDLGLFLLISSAVNLHHFILDGAIWKLRDGRVARILLGRPEPAAPAAPRPPGRRLVLVACAPLLAIAVTTAYARGVLLPAAVNGGDETTAALVERALTWVGRDEPGFHERQAAALLARGDVAGAASAYESALAITPTAGAWSGLGVVRGLGGDAYGARQSFERSLSLRPTPEAWVGIGGLRELERDANGAIAAYQAALALDPDHVPALARSGRWWLAQQRPERGREFLERAAALAPDDLQLRADLARAGAPGSPR